MLLFHPSPDYLFIIFPRYVARLCQTEDGLQAEAQAAVRLETEGVVSLVLINKTGARSTRGGSQ